MYTRALSPSENSAASFHSPDEIWPSSMTGVLRIGTVIVCPSKEVQHTRKTKSENHALRIPTPPAWFGNRIDIVTVHARSVPSAATGQIGDGEEQQHEDRHFDGNFLNSP